ncbi:hypothetical protein [Saccharibacillus sacchari]|uniref:hypothetical protein n=1 Tax=Saccharibacillus sacchari TaxID=456493 RepID=UPI0004B6ECFB|nr:hypothetical protein [Saccharibacillus sacchari]
MAKIEKNGSEMQEQATSEQLAIVEEAVSNTLQDGQAPVSETSDVEDYSVQAEESATPAPIAGKPIAWLAEHNGSKLFLSPVGYIIKSKVGDSYQTKSLTNFTLEATLLINEKSGHEEYIMTVESGGRIYRNRRIEVADISTASNLIQSLGIMGLVVTGTAAEYALLVMYLRKSVRRTVQASDVLGFRREGFLVMDGVIQPEGISDAVVLLSKKGDSHADIYDVPVPELGAWQVLAKQFLGVVLNIGARKKLLILLGWILASVLKEPIFQKYGVKFPSLQLYGSKGAGKTSVISELLKFLGHKDPKALPTERRFGVLKRLSMTNTLPVYLDEYRESLPQAASVKQILRNAYDRRDDSRGQSSQELVRYDLLAPLIVAGEDPILDQACQERIVAVAIRSREQNPEAFAELCKIPNKIEFVGGYMRWLLQNESVWDDLFKQATEVAAKHDFSSPRNRKNGACVMFGLLLGLRLCNDLGIKVYTLDEATEAVASLAAGPENTFGDQLIEIMATVRDRYNKIFNPGEFLVELTNDRLLGHFKQRPLIEAVTGGYSKDNLSARAIVMKLRENADDGGFVKSVNLLKSIAGRTQRVLSIDLTQLCETYPGEFELGDFEDLMKDRDDYF